jgi:hypothetical protein
VESKVEMLNCLASEFVQVDDAHRQQLWGGRSSMGRNLLVEIGKVGWRWGGQGFSIYLRRSGSKIASKMTVCFFSFGKCCRLMIDNTTGFLSTGCGKWRRFQ